VQQESRGRAEGGALGVEWIAEDRVAERGEVEPNLVGAAGEWLDLEPGPVGQPIDHPPPGTAGPPMVAAVTAFPSRIRCRPHGGPAASRRYERRRPAKTPLHKIVSENLESWLAWREAADRAATRLCRAPASGSGQRRWMSIAGRSCGDV
jgi:hypothetical protein